VPTFHIPKSKKEERNMKDKKTWLLAILFMVGLTACATMQSDVKKEPPLPNDVKIIPPASELRKDIAAFSGKWVGAMMGKLISGEAYTFDMILVVEEIHDTWAQVIYSQGDVPRVGAHYFRQKSKVISDLKPKIVVEVKHFPDISFEMKDSNTLEGKRKWGEQVDTFTLRRTN
jgi:hypothetical protein